MMSESHVYEKKSLRKAFGKTADLDDLAKTCVCLANAQGGFLHVGIENKDELPPAGQRITQEDANQLLRSLTDRAQNVGLAAPQLVTAANGGQFIEFWVHPSVHSIATTSDGRTYMRLGEQCRPVSGHDMLRLASEKSGFQWELHNWQKLPAHHLDAAEIAFFLQKVREASAEKVSPFVKAKTTAELLEYYNLAQDGIATNLGVLWLGTPAQRARLRYPLAVQYLVYDELEQRIRKETWLDHHLNPLRLLEEVLSRGVELHYFHEVPAGLYRRQVRRYPEAVLRELLANAFAHRLYTVSADVAIRVYPNRLEIESPGGLPLGVTPATILHERVRRNPALMLTFQATGLMEGEGSGYDLIYEKLTRDAKPLPELDDSFNNLRVTIPGDCPRPQGAVAARQPGPFLPIQPKGDNYAGPDCPARQHRGPHPQPGVAAPAGRTGSHLAGTALGIWHRVDAWGQKRLRVPDKSESLRCRQSGCEANLKNNGAARSPRPDCRRHTRLPQ